MDRPINTCQTPVSLVTLVSSRRTYFHIITACTAPWWQTRSITSCNIFHMSITVCLKKKSGNLAHLTRQHSAILLFRPRWGIVTDAVMSILLLLLANGYESPWNIMYAVDCIGRRIVATALNVCLQFTYFLVFPCYCCLRKTYIIWYFTHLSALYLSGFNYHSAIKSY